MCESAILNVIHPFDVFLKASGKFFNTFSGADLSLYYTTGAFITSFLQSFISSKKILAIA
jgi:hypothetical protein